MIYGGMYLSKHWLMQSLVVWRHQAITWTNVDLSSKMFCGIHLRVISPGVLTNLIRNMWTKTTVYIYYHIPRDQCANRGL